MVDMFAGKWHPRENGTIQNHVSRALLTRLGTPAWRPPPRRGSPAGIRRPAYVRRGGTDTIRNTPSRGGNAMGVPAAGQKQRKKDL